MYTTTWCGYCKRLKRMMQDDGIVFAEVDIEQVPGTAEIVERRWPRSKRSWQP
ncbi:MAG: glutaredoxin family protein [Actinobacteria bacterium]|nr:glutaredoxin family protein [Actinomycetota bacterium]